jgi:hypothetical protein
MEVFSMSDQKVVCIKSDWKPNRKYPGLVLKHPVKDEICTVIETIKQHNKLYFRIKGYDTFIFNTHGFVPLDEYLDQFTGALKNEIAELNYVAA